jgi:hypothetical protein
MRDIYWKDFFLRLFSNPNVAILGSFASNASFFENLTGC